MKNRGAGNGFETLLVLVLIGFLMVIVMPAFLAMDSSTGDKPFSATTTAEPAEALPVTELNTDEERKKSVITIGNSSWLPLDPSLYVGATEHAKEILSAKKRFEESFPELEITGWKIQEREHPWYMFGLWIDHCPKEKVSAEKEP